MSLRGLWWSALFVVVLLAPVPLGAIETEWCMPLALAAIALGAGRAVLGPALRGQRPRFPLVLTPLVLLLVWTVIPVFPLPEEIVGVLGPERLTVPSVPDAESRLALSLYPGGTVEQSVLLLAVLYVMWSVVQASPRPAFRLVAVVGVVHAVAGLVLQETGGSGAVSGTDTTRIGGLYLANEILTPFGTYVNKNHFAGLMLVGAGGVLAVLLRRLRVALRSTEGAPFRTRFGELTGRGLFRLVVPGLGLFVICIALFASGSRGAAIAFVVAAVGVFALLGWATRRFRFRAVAAGMVLLTGALLVATASSSVSVMERLRPEGRFMNRPRLWHDVLVMSGKYPLFGIGAGAFEVGFPRYQSFDEERRFTHAEGDWVQVLGENGVPGALLLFAFGVLLIRRFLRLARSGGTNAALAAGASVGVLGVVGHGFLDTGLHMPANLVAAAILTAGFMAISPSGRTRAQRLATAAGIGRENC